jgi:hypothetical protein
MTDEFIDATIASLKIIGMVQQNGRLCVRRGQLSLDGADRTQGVRRWMMGDSRDVAMLHVKSAIAAAVKISRMIINTNAVGLADSSRWTLARMFTELNRCEVGLHNLKMTYTSDSMMIANLDVLIDRVVAHEAEIVRFADAHKIQLSPSVGNSWENAWTIAEALVVAEGEGSEVVVDPAQ